MPVPVLPGTLDLLILKAVSLGPQHGYGVLLRIEQVSGSRLLIEQGALYPALYRLETKGWLSSDWGVSENNRKAKFYTLTSEGRKRLAKELGEWNEFAAGMTMALASRKAG
jgi:transcriptional regulator